MIFFLRLRGIKISKEATIRPHCYFHSNKITIGNSVINRGCRLYSSTNQYNGGHIFIGNNVAIGFDTTLCCITHEIGSSAKRAGKHLDKDIIIEDGVWIGANVLVLPGVTIGKGAIIAAGAVVNRSVEPNTLYGGIPAKKIRDLQ